MSSPDQLLIESHKFTAGALIVSKNAKSIVRQEDITSTPKLPDLPFHQEQARKLSRVWLDTIALSAYATLKLVTDYAETFCNIYEEMVKELNEGDMDHTKQEILKLASKLLDDLKRKKEKCMTVKVNVKEFSDKYRPLAAHFDADYAIAVEAITSDDDTLKTLDAKRTALNDELKTLYPMTFIPFAGIYYAIKYDKVSDETDSVNNQISQTNAELHSMQIVQNQLSLLKYHSDKITDLAQDVTDGWESLVDNMNEVIDHLVKVSEPNGISFVIEIQLGAAKKDWQNVLQQANMTCSV